MLASLLSGFSWEPHQWCPDSTHMKYFKHHWGCCPLMLSRFKLQHLNRVPAELHTTHGAMRTHTPHHVEARLLSPRKLRKFNNSTYSFAPILNNLELLDSAVLCRAQSLSDSTTLSTSSRLDAAHVWAVQASAFLKHLHTSSSTTADIPEHLCKWQRSANISALASYCCLDSTTYILSWTAEMKPSSASGLASSAVPPVTLRFQTSQYHFRWKKTLQDSA